MCRVIEKHFKAAVPWINEHVTVTKGMYQSYTGTVVDVHIPKPFTVLDVYIPQLRQTVKIRHDYLIDTLWVSFLCKVDLLISLILFMFSGAIIL
ncbi:hypothetical protein K435DRAFT_361063 [Dendrothele bispora CBS 962.96]|uniref:KOW domain-containing protein n=1 Tax=Dendrothele bispora (strain CBS 962.96) TaxID=1314807 RepID=A0A4S8MI17_DENBC|nr:hypothetical protein K435DRAFT_361063 [Dendrothele bispora CBS 962.96]